LRETAAIPSERTLILAPRGCDAAVAKEILNDARLDADICRDLNDLVRELKRGADLVIVTEEAVRNADIRDLVAWVESQPPWSDFAFVLVTEHGDGLERNPSAARLTGTLGNVTFIERPFHPTTLVSVVQTSLRGRRRQYECKRLNEELESRVEERTAELAAANRQLLTQIEERERVESTLRQMQRLEAVGQLTSGVAHDFNNLLTVLLGNIGFLEKTFASAGIDGKLAQRLGHMRIAAERGARLTDQLLSFSRRQRLEPRPLKLNDIVAGMHDLLQSTMGGSIYIETRLGTGLPTAMADPTQLELALLNLAINARDAMPTGGTLTVVTDDVTLSPPFFPEEPPAGDYVCVSVSDTGTGIASEIRTQVFEPFFTTKEVGKGSGLGLSQVLGFAKQSGGGVRIESRHGAGTAVHIYLPRAAATPRPPEPITVQPAATRDLSNTHILLVDDDDDVRDVIRAMLQDLGYVVSEAGSGGAALDLLDREPNIALLVVDFAMPGMNGAEVARLAQARRPGLPVLFITGFAEHAPLAGIAESSIVGKPFVLNQLASRVRLALSGETAEWVADAAR
jgi:signal transduction histidine kinase